MLTSINPLGERIRGNRWVVTVAWLIAGGALGGAVLGGAAGLVGELSTGSLSDSTRLVVLTIVLAAAAVWDLAGRRFPGRRQVDENWLTTYRGWVYGVGFGAQLGAGVVTVVNTALVPAMLVAAVLSESRATGVAIGAAYGATRGLTVLLTAPVRTPDDLRALHRRVDQLDQHIRRIGAGASLGLSLLVAVAVGA